MDLTLDPDHQLLAETARSFVERSCPTSRVRAAAAAPDGFDAELWRTVAGLGWAGLAIDEVHGGAGQGMLTLAVLAEALGYGPVPSPLIASTLAALAIASGGDADQRAAWLPRLASGEAIGTIAVLEPGARDEWEAPRMAGGTTLQGTRVLVPWAATAQVVVVSTTEGWHLVEAGPAVRTTRHDDLDADPLFEVTFTDAPAARLGGTADRGPGRGTMAWLLDHAAVLQLAYAAGAADRALALTVQHAKDRTQFGRPIGSFQAVAHRCVDMRTDLDACRYLAYRAAWALDQGRDADLEVASAKAYGNDALRRIFGHAHQVHGAIGFSTEHDLHLFTRRAKALELSYGSTGLHLDRVATAMGLR